MFKRLLFGNEESKLNFKTSTTSGIARLYTEPSIPISDTQYWLKYLNCFESANDVFSLLSVSDVRRALIIHPENIRTLVFVLVKHLETLQHDADFSPFPEEISSNNVAGISAGLTKNVVDWMPMMGVTRTKAEDMSGNGRDRTREALNCCRVLTRVLPVIMEGDHDATCNAQADGTTNQSGSLVSDEYEMDLLWALNSTADITTDLLASNSIENQQRDTSDQENQFVIAESDEDERESSTDPLGVSDSRNQSLTSIESIRETKSTGPTLGERLISSTIDLLFYSGFTVPWTEEHLSQSRQLSVLKSRSNYCIWDKGIGSSMNLPGTMKAHESNRVELLRLLLVLMSKTVYIPAHLQISTDNVALRHITTSLERRKVLPLLCSLLNVSIIRVKNEGWFGGLASIPAGIVKDRIVGVGEDPRQSTVLLSLQVLNVLLSYESPMADAEQDTSISSFTPYLSPRPSLQSTRSFQSMQSITRADGDGPINIFRLYISKLHRHSDFAMLSDGIFTILSQRLSPASLLNPGVNTSSDTSSAGPHIPETFLLLWKLLGHNGKFKSFFLGDSDKSPQLLSHLLYHALNNKDSAARQGLVRLAIFILHDISCESTFAINICKAGSGAKARITSSQRWGIAVGGGGSLSNVGRGTGPQSQAPTGADLLLQAVYSLIASTKSTLSALYPPLIITITNLSPYFKNLSILSSTRLLALFTSFSNPGFLLADEGNPRLLYYLLEAFNIVIQHSFEKNANLIYALVQNHRQVEKLANFTLRGGIAEMRRLRKKAGVIESSLLGTPRVEIEQPLEQEKRAEEITGQEGEMTGVQSRNEETITRAPANSISAQTPASEKARGKMRRTSASSEATVRGEEWQEEDEEDRLVAAFNEEELYFAASTIGRNGFVPSQAWVTSWQKGLPLDTLQLTLLELVPKVQDLCSTIATKSDANERVVAFLREQSLKQILPPAPPTQPRAFRWTAQVKIWLLSYLWGLIYVSSSLPFGLFVGSNARLFQLRIQDGGNLGGRRIDQMALSNVGNMVFGGLSQVLGLGITNSTSQGQTTNQASNGQTRQSQLVTHGRI